MNTTSAAPPGEQRTRVKIVVPTHNRLQGLREVLQQAVSNVQESPDLDVDIVVVENGSDVSRLVAEQHGARYLFKAEGNASRARNAGADHIPACDLLVFLDDDAVPEQGWLRRLVAPLIDGIAEATVGGVHVAFETSVDDDVRRAFVDTSLTMDPAHPFLIGMNMAVRPDLFWACGGFDEELGPGALGGGEDVLVGLQISARGGRLAYVPGALVHHVVPASRLTDSALLARCAGAGRGEGWIMHHWLGSSPKWLRLRRLRTSVLLLVTRDARRRRALTEDYWRERQLASEAGKPLKFKVAVVAPVASAVDPRA